MTFVFVVLRCIVSVFVNIKCNQQFTFDTRYVDLKNFNIGDEELEILVSWLSDIDELKLGNRNFLRSVKLF